MYLYIILSCSIAVLFVIILIKVKSESSKGKKGEKSVAKILKKCEGKTLNGICLPLYETITEIDHIFIGKMGIVVIETKNIGGSLHGDEKDKYITHNIGRRTHSLYNPLFQNKTHCDNVLYHLKKANIYNIPIYSIIVFVCTEMKNNITGKGNFIKIGNLFSYINSLPQSRNKIPVEKIFNQLNTIRQKSVIKLYNHNKNINKLK